MFIKEETDRSRISGALAASLRAGKALPELVFDIDFEALGFEQFDYALSADFWSVLQSLARAAGEREIWLGALTPSIDWYRESFSVTPWLRIPITASAADYWNAINRPFDPRYPDSLLITAESMFWLSERSSFVVYGDRSSELCVLAAKKLVPPVFDEVARNWKSAGDAAKSFLYKHAPNFESVAQRLKECYPTKSR
ncbi:hypothetical protein [Tahibacter amnicola]|uniref:Uncharacterized protein n=1 Tax=Tahibacter amnicola TaxID=2976241 RepID=A0ABY6BKR4_9GAMM|nr:hypothetical protein [Tahibacter amnicola]UXI70359.1 hypothetical protein N4264_12215 [Tahibacter amnicola]